MKQSLTINNLEMRLLTALIFTAIAILIFAFNGSAQSTAFVQQAKLLASDGAGTADTLGYSVAVSGDTAIVGAPRNGPSRGAAYVYVRTGTTWTQQQKLIHSDAMGNDQFGYSVAISGNTAAVGRYNTTTGVNRSDGKVYIFTRTGTTWAETQILVSSDIAQGDVFGNSLAFENDTLVIGATLKNNGASIFFQGAAYVFTRPAGGGNFTQQEKLMAPDGGFADYFGYSVSLSGDTAVIGAPGQSGAGAASGRGWAYVFSRTGTDWTFQQKLLAADGVAGAVFGFAISVSGNTTVIGARLDSVNGVAGQGSVYVFERSGAVWSQTQKLVGVETPQRNDAFGSSVAIKGDIVAIGAPAHEYVGSIANHGAVYVFSRATAGGQFARTEKLLHNDPAPDALGTSVAFDGASIIAGAPSKDSARGASYIFNSIPTNGQSRILGPSVPNYTQYGNRYVSLSDNTALVGSLNFGTALFQKIGGAWQFVRILTATVTGSDTAPLSGGNAIAGDVMVVGSSTSRVNNVNAFGAAYVFNRVNGTWSDVQRLLPPDTDSNRSFGGPVTMTSNTIVIGDLNKTEGSNLRQGAVYVYVLTGSTWTFQQKLLAADGAANDNFGQSVAISGDTIVVGAPSDDTDGIENKGSVYVFTRSGTTWTQQTRLSSTDGAFGDGYGGTVAIDGSSIVVASPLADNGVAPSGGGAAYVYVGSGASFAQSQKLVSGEADGFTFANSLAISGDNLVIGSPRTDDTVGDISNCGAAFLYRRNGATFELRERLLAYGRRPSDSLGTSVGIFGETVIAGAPGIAYIFPPPAVASVPVSVSGRVTTPGGNGLRNAIVTMTDPQGIRTIATTSSFGIFTFEGILSGRIYTITISSKRYRYAARSQQIDNNITLPDFVGLE